MYPDDDGPCIACHLPGGASKKDFPEGYWCPWCGYMLVEPSEKKKYEKPDIIEEKEMHFSYKAIQNLPTKIACRQCSSCHSCR